MKYRNIFLLAVSFLLGFTLFTQYYSYRNVEKELSRGSSLNYVSQVNLLVTDNEQLKTEAERLQKELDNLRSTADANALLNREIANYRLLTGKDPVLGPGVKIMIDLNIEHYWLVDLLNELYLAGAQAISLNDLRLTGKEGFLAEEETENFVIYLNNTESLARPYTIQAIGNPDTLYNYLTRYDSSVKRMQSDFIDGKDKVKVSKEEGLEIT